MHVVGIAVKLETEGRPTARGMSIQSTTGNLVFANSFAFTGDDVDFTRQLFELSEATRSRISALQPARVVICRADFPPRGSRSDGPKLRLLAEGAIAAAARAEVGETFLATGQEIGQWDGTSKEDVKTKAKAIVQAHKLPLKWVEATVAAIGALIKP